MRTTVDATETLEAIAVAVLGGVLTAFALFAVSASTPGYVYTGPLCQLRTVADPGFDPWTGEPHGRIFDCRPLDRSPISRVIADPPTELIGRRAVPLPLGFGLGVFIALMWLRSARGSPSRPWNPEETG
jgi:hypothetical protein